MNGSSAARLIALSAIRGSASTFLKSGRASSWTGRVEISVGHVIVYALRVILRTALNVAGGKKRSNLRHG